jgi:hypothetical protein
VIEILAMALALQATPSRKTTDLDEFSEVSGWNIYQSFKSDTCVSTASFVGGSSLSMHWRPRTENLAFFYEDAKMESVADDKEYKVKISFVKGQTLDDGWGERTARGTRSLQNVPQLYFNLPGAVALTDVASNDLIAINYKDRLVASLDLQGSAAMVRELRRCSAQVLANHPIDPFEE